jgi:hypothetical protein
MYIFFITNNRLNCSPMRTSNATNEKTGRLLVQEAFWFPSFPQIRLIPCVTNIRGHYPITCRQELGIHIIHPDIGRRFRRPVTAEKIGGVLVRRARFVIGNKAGMRLPESPDL